MKKCFRLSIFNIRKNMKIPLRCIGIFGVCITLISGCNYGKESDSGQNVNSDTLTILTIGTADRGGTMYPVGEAIADVITEADNNIKVNISASHGSADNVEALVNGEIDLGLVSGDVAYTAYHGEEERKDTAIKNLRAIAAIYPSLSNWLVSKETEIQYVHELVGMRIGVGPQSSTTEVAANVVLELMQIDEENSEIQNCGIGSGVEEIRKGTLDAIHGFTGVPIGSLEELAQERPCTLLGYTESELNIILEENAFYYRDIIPAGTYTGQEEDVLTFGTKCILCVDASMEEGLVYRLTRDLSEYAEKLGEKHGALGAMMQEGFMDDELPLPLHPGAEKWYKEMKRTK